MPTSCCRRRRSGSATTCTRRGPAPGTTRSICARRSRRCTSAATTSTSSPISPGASASTATATRPKTSWLRELTADAVDDFDAFAEPGVARFPPPEDAVAFARQIRDPEQPQIPDPVRQDRDLFDGAGRTPDPYGLGAIPPIPTWIAPPAADPRYPLALCTPKSQARTHSIHGNQPASRVSTPTRVWLHPDDARRAASPIGATGARLQRARRHDPAGDGHRPRSPAGSCRSRKAPGSHPTRPAPTRKAAPTSLTADRSAPCGATTYNTNCVEVEAGVALTRTAPLAALSPQCGRGRKTPSPASRER